MRASSAMKLLSACCGGFLMSVPVDAQKVIYDYRPPGDFETKRTNCANALQDETRYIQVEVFDYNLTPWIKATWRQVGGECGETEFDPYEVTMEYNGNIEGNITAARIQLDMYICGPWGDYELEVEVKSTNGGEAMKRVAWEIEYGADEYHIWDTLNTPFYGRAGHAFGANDALPSDYPYAPFPNEYSGEGDGTTYKWPYPEAEGYYSLMYTGPFPPLQCPNLYPEGVDYVGCYDQAQPGWTTPTSPDGPTGSDNDLDPAELYRMFDGIEANNDGGDDGVDEEGVMTLEKCASICDGYSYFGLQNAIQCTCGNTIEGSSTENCGLVDDNIIPEYWYLCSGDSRVLCGTETMVSIYSLDGGAPSPSPTPAPVDASTSAPVVVSTPAPVDASTSAPVVVSTPAPVDASTSAPVVVSTPAPVDASTSAPAVGGGYEPLGCFADNQPDASGQKIRIMTRETSSSDMTAEVCFLACSADSANTHFGTQFRNECWCVEDPDLESITQFSDVAVTCNKKCAGDSTEKCGGRDAMSVYEIN